MRKSLPVWLILIASLTLAGSRESECKRVEEAVKKGLPKTAIEELEPIIKQAIKEKAYGEALKAICRKITLEATIQGNKPEEKIIRLQAEIEKSPKEIKPLMEAILANWYWHYFQQNRWRFLQRTQTAGVPAKDFTTWDLTTILDEIGRHFDLALSEEKRLVETPVTEYKDFLVAGTVPDSYRPTLYDFIAHNAIEFYSSGEQAGTRPEDTFELSAASPIFSEAEEFIRWQVQTTDSDSPVYKALRLYQKLLSFHLEDKDKTAFIDVDLHRLNFGYNQAFGEEKKERYKAALKRFVEKWADHEISSRARYHWAAVLQEENELVKAHQIAGQGYHSFPESIGGRWCYNLMKQIEAKSLSIETERVWTEPWPKIKVSYRNITKVFFRAIPFDYEQRLTSRVWNPEYLNGEERKEILKKKPVREWSVNLPTTSDYQQRTEEIGVPDDLSPGFYFVLASQEPAFGERDNQISVLGIWVSRLALVIRSGQKGKGMEGFVLLAKEGKPVSGAEVKLWQRDDRGWKLVSVVTTDENGIFRFPSPPRLQHILLASYEDEKLASQPNYSYETAWQPPSYTRTIFFTDRSLYRPGQIISYKGICIQVDQNENNYQVLPLQSLRVVFRDVNGKEISRQDKKTNEYGSFSGSFVAPTDRLTGRVSIQVESGPPGSATVSVEEYKRPKFQVTLSPPDKAVRLNQPVEIQGK
ncbi:MAG: MG2 domain-containing protein, partial [Candidatus Omnitrophica bacterium]|nr:MG2 domain-containing protein [Candidatus Omnitrophota bacterium]